MNRARARLLWAQVAAGGHYDEAVQEWLRTVAKNMLDADKKKNGNERASALAAATGLRGEVDQAVVDRRLLIMFYGHLYPEPSPTNPPLRDFLANVLNPAAITQPMRDSLAKVLGRPVTDNDFAKSMSWDVTDETADKRIRDALAKLKPDERKAYDAVIARAGRKPRHRK
jgi:DNA-directed RNA polymerase specialized sigma24 family protein